MPLGFLLNLTDSIFSCTLLVIRIVICEAMVCREVYSFFTVACNGLFNIHKKETFAIELKRAKTIV